MKKIITLVFLFLLLFVWNWSLQEQGSEKFNILATTTHMGSVASDLVQGTDLTVKTLFPPGVDPHLYTLSAADLELIKSADLIIANGLHLEASMYEGLKLIDDQLNILFVGDSLSEQNLIQVATVDPKYDPHFWFDLDLMTTASELIFESIINQFSSIDATLISANLDDFQMQLNDLKSLQIEMQINADLKYLVTTHDAFSYLARVMGFEVKSLIGITTEADFSLKEIRDLADFMVENQISDIYTESTVNSKPLVKLQEILAQQGFEANFVSQPLLGDSLQAGQTFIDYIRYNLMVIYE